MSNKTRLYIYVAFLFVFTFLLASTIFSGIKTREFNYTEIAIFAPGLIYAAFQVVKRGKIENNKTE